MLTCLSEHGRTARATAQAAHCCRRLANGADVTIRGTLTVNGVFEASAVEIDEACAESPSSKPKAAPTKINLTAQTLQGQWASW